jgi:hypothetical protein
MRRAAEIGRAFDLSLYIHFGQLWPLPEDRHPYDADAVLPDMLKILRPGDILAHPFTRHPGGFVNQHGKLHPVVREAPAQGLKTDVGHGSHFSFKMARLVLDAGIVPDALGADMYGYNTTIPRPRGTPEAHPDKEEMHMFAGQHNFSLASANRLLRAAGQRGYRGRRRAFHPAALLPACRQALRRRRGDPAPADPGRRGLKRRGSRRRTRGCQLCFTLPLGGHECWGKAS